MTFNKKFKYLNWLYLLHFDEINLSWYFNPIESNFVLQNTGGGVDEEYLKKQFESVNKQFEETKALLGQLGGKTEGRSEDTLKLEIKLAEETKAKEDLQSRLGKETLAKINLEKRIQSLQVYGN